MAARLLRNAINSFIPNWLSNRVGLQNAFKTIYAVALVGDLMIETGWQGFLAALPGVGTPTALPLIAQGRGLRRGESESTAAFALRLRNWLTTWNGAGASEILAQQIQVYLGNAPTVRVVDRAGHWASAHPDGTVTKTIDAAWNWDGVTYPARAASWWSDLWIIITPAEWASYANASDPAWTAAWGTSSSGVGLAITPTAIDAILSLVATWKGDHMFVVAIILSTDPALFVPGSLSTAGNPDGTWGNWGKTVNGVRVPARTTETAGGVVRYWHPAGGG